MPAYSTLRTFIDSLRTGQTNITRSLDQILSNPGEYRDNEHYDWISQPDALRKPMPGWLRRMLRDAGVSEPEIDHIDRWPNAQKELVRQRIVESIDNDRPMHFRWELHDGDKPANTVDTDSNVVTFKSPRAGVHLSNLNLGAIHVDA